MSDSKSQSSAGGGIEEEGVADAELNEGIPFESIYRPIKLEQEAGKEGKEEQGDDPARPSTAKFMLKEVEFHSKNVTEEQKKEFEDEAQWIAGRFLSYYKTIDDSQTSNVTLEELKSSVMKIIQHLYVENNDILHLWSFRKDLAWVSPDKSFEEWEIFKLHQLVKIWTERRRNWRDVEKILEDLSEKESSSEKFKVMNREEDYLKFYKTFWLFYEAFEDQADAKKLSIELDELPFAMSLRELIDPSCKPVMKMLGLRDHLWATEELKRTHNEISKKYTIFHFLKKVEELEEMKQKNKKILEKFNLRKTVEIEQDPENRGKHVIRVIDLAPFFGLDVLSPEGKDIAKLSAAAMLTNPDFVNMIYSEFKSSAVLSTTPSFTGGKELNIYHPLYITKRVTKFKVKRFTKDFIQRVLESYRKGFINNIKFEVKVKDRKSSYFISVLDFLNKYILSHLGVFDFSQATIKYGEEVTRTLVEDFMLEDLLVEKLVEEAVFDASFYADKEFWQEYQYHVWSSFAHISDPNNQIYSWTPLNTYSKNMVYSFILGETVRLVISRGTRVIKRIEMKQTISKEIPTNQKELVNFFLNDQDKKMLRKYIMEYLPTLVAVYIDGRHSQEFCTMIRILIPELLLELEIEQKLHPPVVQNFSKFCEIFGKKLFEDQAKALQSSGAGVRKKKKKKGLDVCDFMNESQARYVQWPIFEILSFWDFDDRTCVYGDLKTSKFTDLLTHPQKSYWIKALVRIYISYTGVFQDDASTGIHPLTTAILDLSKEEALKIQAKLTKNKSLKDSLSAAQWKRLEPFLRAQSITSEFNEDFKNTTLPSESEESFEKIKNELIKNKFYNKDDIGSLSERVFQFTHLSVHEANERISEDGLIKSLMDAGGLGQSTQDIFRFLQIIHSMLNPVFSLFNIKMTMDYKFGRKIIEEKFFKTFPIFQHNEMRDRIYSCIITDISTSMLKVRIYDQIKGIIKIRNIISKERQSITKGQLHKYFYKGQLINAKIESIEFNNLRAFLTLKNLSLQNTFLTANGIYKRYKMKPKHFEVIKAKDYLNISIQKVSKNNFTPRSYVYKSFRNVSFDDAILLLKHCGHIFRPAEDHHSDLVLSWSLDNDVISNEVIKLITSPPEGQLPKELEINRNIYDSLEDIEKNYLYKKQNKLKEVKSHKHFIKKYNNDWKNSFKATCEERSRRPYKVRISKRKPGCLEILYCRKEEDLEHLYPSNNDRRSRRSGYGNHWEKRMDGGHQDGSEDQEVDFEEFKFPIEGNVELFIENIQIEADGFRFHKTLFREFDHLTDWFKGYRDSRKYLEFLLDRANEELLQREYKPIERPPPIDDALDAQQEDDGRDRGEKRVSWEDEMSGGGGDWKQSRGGYQETPRFDNYGDNGMESGFEEPVDVDKNHGDGFKRGDDYQESHLKKRDFKSKWGEDRGGRPSAEMKKKQQAPAPPQYIEDSSSDDGEDEFFEKKKSKVKGSPKKLKRGPEEEDFNQRMQTSGKSSQQKKKESLSKRTKREYTPRSGDWKDSPENKKFKRNDSKTQKSSNQDKKDTAIEEELSEDSDEEGYWGGTSTKKDSKKKQKQEKSSDWSKKRNRDNEEDKSPTPKRESDRKGKRGGAFARRGKNQKNRSSNFNNNKTAQKGSDSSSDSDDVNPGWEGYSSFKVVEVDNDQKEEKGCVDAGKDSDDSDAPPKKDTNNSNWNRNRGRDRERGRRGGGGYGARWRGRGKGGRGRGRGRGGHRWRGNNRRHQNYREKDSQCDVEGWGDSGSNRGASGWGKSGSDDSSDTEKEDRGNNKDSGQGRGNPSPQQKSGGGGGWDGFSTSNVQKTSQNNGWGSNSGQEMQETDSAWTKAQNSAKNTNKQRSNNNDTWGASRHKNPNGW